MTLVVIRALRGAGASAALAALIGGVPWALWHYIGWPLPDHIPSWGEIQTVLTGAFTTGLLLNVLAVLCWLAWVAFVIDVLRTLPAAVRTAIHGTPRPAITMRAAPVHALAAVLVTAVVFAMLGQRPQPTPTPATAGGQLTTELFDGALVPAAHTAPTVRADSASEDAARTAVVREPRGDVHDSLWRIACRELGDGTRWPEIYRLNKGRPQPDGQTLTNPDLIYPGWILILPDPPATPGTDESAPDPDTEAEADDVDQPTPTPPPVTTATPSSPPPTPPTTADPQPTETAGQARTAPVPPTATGQPSRPPGLDLGPGVFVGLGLAAAISAAGLVARRHRRRWYQPGSGYRADLPVAPIVRTLHVARVTSVDATSPDPDEADPVTDAETGTTPEAGRPPSSSPRTAPPAGVGRQAGLTVGVHDDHQVVLDLARHRGLGLVGAGAAGVARGLLLGLLTAPETATTRVVIPHDEADGLLDLRGAHRRWPTRLCVVPSLDAALDEIQRDFTRRADTSDPSDDPAMPLVVLLATPRTDTSPRLQAALDNGSTMGVTGILLGQWRSGATAQIRDDGTVRTTNPGGAERLRGARLFTLPAAQAADMLTLLRDTETPASEPASTSDQPAGTDTSQTAPRASPAAAGVTGASTTDDARHQRSGVALSLSILGTPRLTWHQPDADRDLTTSLTGRQRDLLVFLALHPDGVQRETLIEKLWPHGPADRPANALHTTLSRLRRTLHTTTSDYTVTGLVTTHGDRYQLDPDVVDVDYWQLTGAVHQSRAAASDADRHTADQQIIATYHGELAAGVHNEWIEVPREAARRDAVDAAARLADNLEADPQQALHLLEVARDFDPYNELIYRDIMRLQARLGRPDAISRTLTLLTTRLVELDEHPDPGTVALARELRHDQ